MRVSWLISLKSFTRARLGRQFGYLIFFLLAAGLGAGIFVVSWLVLGYLRSPQLSSFVDAPLFLAGVPGLVLTGAFFTTLLFSFGVLLQSLYLAGDMEFLLSAPVPIRAVFIAKLLQAILPSLALTALFALPLLFGLGASGQYNLLYYLLVLLELAALVLGAACLAGLLVMVVVRVFPARAVAEVLGVAGGIVGLVLSQSGHFWESSGLSPGQGLQLLTRLDNRLSPLSWAGRGLLDVGQGRWWPGMPQVLVPLVLAGLVILMALTTAERLYYSGWSRVTTARVRKPTRRSTSGTRNLGLGDRLGTRMMPPVLRGLLIKDALTVRRDLRSMSQLVSPLILGLIYSVVFIQGGGEPPAGRGQAPAWFMHAFRSVFVYGNAAIALFVGWMLMSRLAVMSFSQEGKNYWLIKSAPVSTHQLLAAKFLVAYLPTLMLGWGFLLTISLLQRAGSASLLYGLPVVALCLAGGTGINLSFGVTNAKLDWEDPRRMVSTAAGCLGVIAGAAYMVLCLALFFGPPLAFVLLGGPEAAGQLIGLVLGGSLSIACATFPLWLVRNRVPRIGEA